MTSVARLLAAACVACITVPAPAAGPAGRPGSAAAAVSAPAGGESGPAGVAAALTGRPRVGLVLGGGGARGAAHIGVLEVLERLRVPVDCVAGTSMGALVAGAWVAGISPERMREALGAADWDDMFQDNPDFSELSLRNKRLSQRYLPGSELGVQDGGVAAPRGVVGGQKMKLFFNQLVGADAGERLIEKLPLPVSIIATDIGTGERVVLRDGSLTQAMRASMSVPGLLAPLDYRGRRLVDGGLVDNVPIREVRERCGAELVIAVNVGSPLLEPEEVTGLLSITTQMVNLLTEQNVQASLATLRPDDIYIQPELGSITAADFERHEGAAERGRTAAEAVAPRLAALAVDAERYAHWLRTVAGRERDVPRIDEVRIAGLARVNEAVVRRHVSQDEGAPLDTATLNRDLLRVYGDGWYESVDYSVFTDGTRNVLRVMPVEKSWGPDYLRFGLQLDSNLGQGSSYQLRAAYHKTWMNRLGGELLLGVDIGSNTGAAVDWYQPVTADGRWFVEAGASYRRERSDYWFQDQRIAEYSNARSLLQLRVGPAFPRLGQASVGWREQRVTSEIETGLDIYSLAPEEKSGGWTLRLDLDAFDALYFPTRGWSTFAEWYQADRAGYSRAEVDLRWAWPWHDYVLGARTRWVGSPEGGLPFNDAAKLGGFLNLSAFASGQLMGDEVSFAQLRAERIIGSLPLGLRGDMRIGAALEAGKVGTPYTAQKKDGWLGSLALYLGGETPFGPVYLGLGLGSAGAVNAYFFVGTP
jgi:NTE family protein